MPPLDVCDALRHRRRRAADAPDLEHERIDEKGVGDATNGAREGVGVGPCREIGLIKEHIKEAILDGEIPNEYQAAHAMMLKKAEELGLQPTLKTNE